ncbi:hypothetical protein BSKO_09319 [Bryopsis sp. KO-2023]|nr:hypothetical protein BSKO_09319 [Bryopsis sp. KO-2023]
MGGSVEDSPPPILEHDVNLRFQLGGEFSAWVHEKHPQQPGAEDEVQAKNSVSVQASSKWMTGDDINFEPITSEGEEGTERKSFSVSAERVVSVNEGLVRTWTASNCALSILLKTTTKRAAVDGTFEDPVESEHTLTFDCSDLVVREGAVQKIWSQEEINLAHLDPLTSLKASLEVLLVPTEGEDGPAEPPETHFLPSDLTKKLNPLVIRPLVAESLPDAPATKELLEKRSFPITLKYKLNDKVDEKVHTGACQSWSFRELEEPSNPMNVRDCLFGGSDVYLVADLSPGGLLDQFSKQPLEFEIHDRDAFPEEEGLIAASRTTSLESSRRDGEDATPEGAAVAADDEGYVCGVVPVSMIDFFRGCTKIDVHGNILPKSTIRGAASLQWQSRPGRYVQALSRLSMTLQLAVPLTAMENIDEAYKPVFGRCVFVFDLRDNAILHAIEDTVRHQNAVALGFLQPRNVAAAESLAEIRSAVADSLTMHTLQSLSTTKLTEAQSASHDLDLITGFQLISGTERIVVVEGEAGQLQQSTVLGQNYIAKSKAIISRYNSRLYGSLGVSLWIIKLRSSLEEILSEGSTFSGVHAASPECIQGLQRLQNLKDLLWSRQAHDLFKFPLANMMSRVDKKFGGRLTKEEVVGTAAGSRKESRSNHQNVPGSDEDESDEDSEPVRLPKPRIKPPLDMDNSNFDAAKNATDSRRALISFVEKNIEWITILEDNSKYVREKWLTWNRDPKALMYLMQSDNGEKILVKRRLSEIPDKNLNKGRASHSSEFQWPATRDPKEFNKHKKKPSVARVEELAAPWVEGEEGQALGMRERPQGVADFVVHFHTNGLFGKDPDFWKSVHLCGASLEKERTAAIRAAIEEWEKKVVVDDLRFRTVSTMRKRVGQVDRMETILKGDAIKYGFQITHVDPAPTSMFSEQPYEEPNTNFERQAEPHKFTSRNDFINHIPMDKRDIHKIGLDSSWRGSLKQSSYV